MMQSGQLQQPSNRLDSSLKTAIRVSQTMPQLHYTKADIQEQYLRYESDQRRQKRPRKRPKSVQRSSPSSAPAASQAKDNNSNSNNRGDQNSAGGLENVAACRGNGQAQAQGEEDDEDGDGLDDSEPSGEGGPASSRRSRQTGGRRSARPEAKRRRRSRSASRLFAACFNIPHLSSMLTSASSSAAPTGRQRSLLSHLRLGGGLQRQQEAAAGRQRPISASQTAGNLRQVAAGGELKTSASSSPLQLSNRKHVSFEGQQQQVALAGQKQTSEMVGGNQQQQPAAATVIMRNYQRRPEAPGECARAPGHFYGRRQV